MLTRTITEEEIWILKTHIRAEKTSATINDSGTVPRGWLVTDGNTRPNVSRPRAGENSGQPHFNAHSTLYPTAVLVVDELIFINRSMRTYLINRSERFWIRANSELLFHGSSVRVRNESPYDQWFDIWEEPPTSDWMNDDN